MAKYELRPKADNKTWKWERHSSGDWAFCGAVMRTKAIIDGGQQECELRLLTPDIEALLRLPQVQKMAKDILG